MDSPEEFWRPWESRASSFAEVVAFIDRVHEDWVLGKGRRFAWRGQVNASWALHSSLYRRLILTRGHPPDEGDVQEEEEKVLSEVKRWGLHCTDGGAQVPVLPQLALLQHYGAPTRLLDITFNAWIAVFFAVAEQWKDGALVNEDEDARLFAIDVTTRIA